MKDDNQIIENKVGIVMVTGSCCIPAMKPIEDQVRAMLEEIRSEISTDIVVKEISVIAAMSGALPQELIAQGMGKFTHFGVEMLPLIIINGEIVSAGYPQKEEIKRVVLGTSKS
jgi:disulfide oxidoreductase YuzD